MSEEVIISNEEEINEEFEELVGVYDEELNSIVSDVSGMGGFNNYNDGEW